MAHYVSADLRYGGRGYPLGGLRGADEFSFEDYASTPDLVPTDVSIEEVVAIGEERARRGLPRGPGSYVAPRPRPRRKCKPGRVKSCKIQVSTLHGKRVRRRVCRDARGLIVSNRPAGSRKRSGSKKRKRGK